uniref:Uncharacterized protein n=1 Tax=Oryza punctata TaxID=4537 RepID=A0A0E0LCZ8_ORYPU
MTVVRSCSPRLLLLLLLVVTGGLVVLPAAASTGKSGKSGHTSFSTKYDSQVFEWGWKKK